MHALLLASLPFLTVPAPMQAADARPTSARIEAAVDPRVELLSLVFRLAGRPEYSQPASHSDYSRTLEEAVAPARDHEVISLAQRLTRERGIAYDAVMSLAVHLTDVETLGERVPFDLPPAALEKRWTSEDARAFVRELADFVEVTRFGELMELEAPFHARAAARLQTAVDALPVLGWFDRFFGPREGARFRVIVGLLNGPANYGARVVLADGAEEILPIIGADRWDAEGLPVFGAGFEELVAHELCHSYTNPLVDRQVAALLPAGERMLASQRAAMERQAYGAAESVLYESLVRACVGRYVLETHGAPALERYLEEQRARGFVWVPALVETLGEYEAGRERWPGLDAFMPRLAERLEVLAAALATPPRVLSTTPADGAADLAPGACELRVEFDRPMRAGSWSVCRTARELPQVSAPAFDAARRVFTLQMTLAPGRTYGLSLNGPANRGFAGEEGVPLEPLELVFSTRAR